MYEIPRKLKRQQEICDLVCHHGIVEVERLLEVHRTTIQRWCHGHIEVPVAAIFALRALKGDFPHMEASKEWSGWHFGRDGKLYDPSGRWYTEGEIRATQFANQLLDANRETIQSLRQQVDRLQAQLDRYDIAANERKAG